jgi:uncharacterized membrane protein YhaH (DUF805 family)
MFEYFKICVTTKYATFTGRARRSEYWYFFLFYVIILFALTFISGAIGETAGGGLILVYYLAIIIPSLAVTWRRMHDVGKSGWYSFIPFYNLILACTDSQPSENEYGPNPKGIGNNKGTDDLINSIGNQ